jgi:NAD(P)-dependent dehydrogenase (short-subunit alcohol dehydrogenase family)
MDAELNGSVALVTGAARNIGREIALALAAAGAAVVVNAKTSGAEATAVAAEIEASGGAAVAILADVSDPADVKRLIAEAVARFGRLDVLVNNAALRDEAPFDELTFERWRTGCKPSSTVRSCAVRRPRRICARAGAGRSSTSAASPRTPARKTARTSSPQKPDSWDSPARSRTISRPRA